jgi:hypothetical protein
MKKVGLFFLSFILVTILHAQTDSLLNSLQTSTTTQQQEILPKKMLFTQRMAWGEHGFMRGNKTITPDIRENDMKIRRKIVLTK